MSLSANQVGEETEDFVDPKLPEGKLVVKPGADWPVVATINAYAPIFCTSAVSSISPLSMGIAKASTGRMRFLLIRRRVTSGRE